MKDLRFLGWVVVAALALNLLGAGVAFLLQPKRPGGYAPDPGYFPGTSRLAPNGAYVRESAPYAPPGADPLPWPIPPPRNAGEAARQAVIIQQYRTYRYELWRISIGY